MSHRYTQLGQPVWECTLYSQLSVVLCCVQRQSFFCSGNDLISDFCYSNVAQCRVAVGAGRKRAGGTIQVLGSRMILLMIFAMVQLNIIVIAVIIPSLTFFISTQICNKVTSSEHDTKLDFGFSLNYTAWQSWF